MGDLKVMGCVFSAILTPCLIIGYAISDWPSPSAIYDRGVKQVTSFLGRQEQRSKWKYIANYDKAKLELVKIRKDIAFKARAKYGVGIALQLDAWADTPATISFVTGQGEIDPTVVVPLERDAMGREHGLAYRDFVRLASEEDRKRLSAADAAYVRAVKECQDHMPKATSQLPEMPQKPARVMTAPKPQIG